MFKSLKKHVDRIVTCTKPPKTYTWESPQTTGHSGIHGRVGNPYATLLFYTPFHFLGLLSRLSLNLQLVQVSWGICNQVQIVNLRRLHSLKHSQQFCGTLRFSVFVALKMKALSILLLIFMILASLPALFCDTDPQDGNYTTLVSETFYSYLD